MFRVSKTREYVGKIRVSLKDIDKMRQAQRAIVEKGLRNEDSGGLRSVLDGLSFSVSLLQLVYKLSSVAALVSSTVGIGLTASSSVKYDTEQLLMKGEIALEGMEDFMNANPKYNLVEFKLSFLEFTSTNGDIVRYCESTSDDAWTVTAVHSSGGWSYL